MDDSLTKKLLLRIRSEPPDPGWFDEVNNRVKSKFNFLLNSFYQVAAVVHNELQQNEKFLSDFKRSVGYLKVAEPNHLLQSLLLHQHNFPAACRAGPSEGGAGRGGGHQYR